ncbi:glycosyltransferase [Kluyvera georgiana]|uniref:glycosyltransferase n=1 Tax=Kluyvera georgiana TaxID=73098 RepID=UPI003220609A
MIYYDITDVINHARFSSRVSGIQRVVLEGLKGLSGDYTIIFISPVTGKVYQVRGLENMIFHDLTPFNNLWIYSDLYVSKEKDTVTKYIKKIKGKSKKFNLVARLYGISSLLTLTRTLSERCILRYLKNKSIIHPGLEITEIDTFQKNSSIALFGGVWNFQDKYQELFETKWLLPRKVFMIHDMIPIVSPYVPDELKNMFKKYIPFVVQFASKVIAVSNCSKEDLVKYCDIRGLSCPETVVVHLSHKLPEQLKERIQDPDFEFPLRTRKLKNEKYALCVGSVESRKNHLNLIILWNKFFNSPEYNNEKLVIAGKWIWDTEEVARALTYSGHVHGSVIVIENADDSEIDELYKNSRFSVYPSHYEGWGLPLGESISHGKPCLHFDNSSLTEAGYGMTLPVEYPNYEAYFSELKKLMIDDEYLQQQITHIESNKHKLRSWNDFSSDIANVFYSEENIK